MRPDGRGAVVRVVGAGTPAALAGMRAGDVILTLADKKVGTALELEQLLKETEPFDAVKLAIERDGASQELDGHAGPPAAGGDSTRVRQQAGRFGAARQARSVFVSADDPADSTIRRSPPESVELAGLNLHGSQWEVVGGQPGRRDVQEALPKLGTRDRKDVSTGKGARRSTDQPRFSGLSLWLDVKVLQHRQPGSPGGLSAGGSHRPADRGRLVCQ